MAAATLVGKRRERVVGDLRMVLAQVTIAANGDTWNTGLKQCIQASVEPTTNASMGFTIGTGSSAGVLTFATGGGALTLNIVAFGYA